MKEETTSLVNRPEEIYLNLKEQEVRAKYHC